MNNNLNYQILANKSLDYYRNSGISIDLDDKAKERFGFYYLGMEVVCGPMEISDANSAIIDTDFCRQVLDIGNDDYGVDAIYIDSEDRKVFFFNFKYRNEYRDDSAQSPKELRASFELIGAISKGDLDSLSDRTKHLASKVRDVLEGESPWELNLVMISNDLKGLDINNIPTLKSQADALGLELGVVVLPDIIDVISNRPTDIDADVYFDSSHSLEYEDSETDRKSFVIRIPAYELIRMTCDNPDVRKNIEVKSPSEIAGVNIDNNVLFDNVRGFLGDTSYNNGMIATIKNAPSKFFMFNNGVTMTARSATVVHKALRLKKYIHIEGMQIVNGGQTLRSLYRYLQEGDGNLKNLKKAYVSVRIFVTSGDNVVTAQIAEYTNSQNAISASDLKSISNLQIQIGQKMAENGILYRRKVGDIGEDSGDYSHEVTMERLAQILYSKQGRPDRASNQKKKLFDKYYDDIFPDDIAMDGLAQEILQFEEIKAKYAELDIEGYDQKFFYIVYLQEKRNDIEENIKLLEQCLKEFRNSEDIPAARKLIQTAFLELVEAKISAVLRK